MSPPKHVAIIMDGNGRWAEQRGLPRTKGHQRGVENLRTIVKAAGNAGVSFLTLFAFSAENWSRPPQEVNDLMGLMKLFIRRDLSALHGEGVRIRIIGERANLSPDILSLLEESERLTAANQRMTLIVAFNYGARQEIVSATQRLAREAAAGRLNPDQIDAAQIEGALDTAGLPDPDLIIRTSGEMRLSNFLLWQSAYSEFVFAPQFWPDFDENAFAAALEEFNSRQRRYGGLCEPQKIAL